MIEITAPEPLGLQVYGQKSLFLGGTIDNGVAEDWQSTVVKDLADYDGYILNPRRKEWISNLEHDLTPGSEFHKQLEWEHSAQLRASIKLYNFLGNSISPVTMLELGSFGFPGDTVVVCDKDYFRYGNVVFMCKKRGIIVFPQLNIAIDYIKYML